jgi:RHS repeat-associated protein
VRKVKGLFDPGDVLPSDPVNRDPYQFHPDTVTHDMVYYIYDHLGNTRVSYTPNINPANVAVSYEVRNMLDYYPSGKLLRTYSQGEGERYLVTGKERDTETGYDCFGARAFESEIVRWLSVDPLTDKYPSWSSYAYVGGNSVLNIDFDGRDWGDVINGAARGVFDNLTGANTRANYRPNSASEYNEALYKADLVSVAFGTMMIVNGGMNISGGVALAPATEGASLAVSIAGTAEVSLGTMLLMNGSKNLGNSESEKKIEKSYKRPNNATTPEQRKSVQGKPCIDCGTGGKMNADHKQPLVKEYYETGKIDKAKMKEVESVQPQCPTCSSRQGAELKKYSQEQKKANGLE